MLSRVSSSLLLKLIIAVTSAALVILLGLSSWDAWRTLGVANRLAAIAEVSGLTFRALHNMRVIRSFTLRGLNAVDTIEPAQESMLNSFNKIATDALRSALIVLPRIEFKNHASLPAEIERSLSRLNALCSEATTEFRKAKNQRRAALVQEFGSATTDFLALLNTANGLLTVESKNQDAFVDQMMMLKDAAWTARNASGDISLMLTAAIMSRRLAADEQLRFASLVGQVQAAWELLERGRVGPTLPATVNVALDKAHEAIFGKELIARRDNIVANVVSGAAPGMSADEWSQYTVPRLSTLTNAGEVALDAAAEHARDQVVRAERNLIIQAALLVAALAIAIGGIFMVTRRVTRPLHRFQTAMMSVAAGDIDIEVPYLDRHDEIGKLAQALAVFKEHAAEKTRIEVAEHERQARAGRRQTVIEGQIAGFERQIGDALKALTSASIGMNTTSRDLFTVAEHTNAQAHGAATSSSEASTNVQTVAAASEELASSIGEIGRQVTHAAEIAARAVRETEETDATVQGLTDAAQRIGQIVSLITAIAEQTNLLALNATIEAARAGEAGRGFAVVASEVKALAHQTAKATEDISGQVGAIRAVAERAVAAMRRVGGTIGEVNEVAASIASAVEEQGAATKEITRNTQEAARRTENASTSIAGVTAGAEKTGNAADAVKHSAEVLGRETDGLRRLVDEFLGNIRAA